MRSRDRRSSDARGPSKEPSPARTTRPKHRPTPDLRAGPALRRTAGVDDVLAVQRAAGNRVVQRLLGSRAEAAATGGEVIQMRAEAGLRAPSGALPHAAQIQASFGRHDIRSVRAHVGPWASVSAASIGAAAYTMGEHTVFAGAPSLRTAAHEAAHVVQQRAGVDLPRGVGQAGDAYERNADVIADRVVSGQSAEGLLDRFVGIDGPARSSGSGRAPVQRIETSWGSPITFSWEKEGDRFGILKYYLPPNMREVDWISMGLGVQPDCVSDTEWQTLLAKEKVVRKRSQYKELILPRAYMDMKGLTYGDLTQQTSSAQGYMRDNLLEEGDGETVWETTHKGHEDDLDAIERQVQWLDSPEASLGKGGYHFHMAFRRPSFGSPAERKRWAERIAAFGAHLDDYASLQLFAANSGFNVASSKLGPYTNAQVEDLSTRLGQERIPHNGIEQTDSSGHNIGLFKLASTAIRQTYDRRFDANRNEWVPDPEMIGFEFRDGIDPQQIIGHMKTVADALHTLPFGVADRNQNFLGRLNPFKEEPAMSLGGAEPRGKAYTESQLVSVKRGGQDTLARAKSKSNKQGVLIEMLERLAVGVIESGIEPLPWTPNASTSEALQDMKVRALLDRWSVPFAEWENHPAVPKEGARRIIEAREIFLEELKEIAKKMSRRGYALTDGREIPGGEFESEGEPREEREVRRAVKMDIEACVSRWADATRLWELF